ncbi:MAG: tRNA (guanosine(37)-N1)-methyltransferase TrmD [Candidatus Delongbacteria bacterium]|nr:tRNA (guanosine(37)-N1)-methyltransferase TrmD [Candidatus Delongbacteria bacterium]
MKIDIISAHPDMFEGFLDHSILKIGKEKGLIEITVHDLRKWTEDKHHTVDDTPYGGGPGMIMKIEPFHQAITELRQEDSFVILTTPAGEIYDQEKAHKFLDYRHLIIICGHYKGIDARIDNFIDMKLSVGDYILTGGELPAAIIVDSVCRLIPGVISDLDSALSDSFENGLLDCSYYTRPYDFMGLKVPEVLTSGNHKKIDEWRYNDSIEITEKYRPELLKKLNKK